MGNKNLRKEVSYEDLTLDEAVKLLSKVSESRRIFTGVGEETHDRQRPAWIVSINMVEVASVRLSDEDDVR